MTARTVREKVRHPVSAGWTAHTRLATFPHKLHHEISAYKKVPSAWDDFEAEEPAVALRDKVSRTLQAKAKPKIRQAKLRAALEVERRRQWMRIRWAREKRELEKQRKLVKSFREGKKDWIQIIEKFHTSEPFGEQNIEAVETAVKRLAKRPFNGTPRHASPRQKTLLS
eukprot:CAMPEP_0175105558 /NCGR_PEP_ID=MMETSP0086_2-20121207/10541_1 /TAXON_ID=136419 /ORGANISM="Unknown Unknown, Strain D1" /LENGTH=168 /DNA_ID=CAMNT_0016381457 /DNA_START=155 /DNA_END=658 /DNA_ORIENTATION=-